MVSQEPTYGTWGPMTHVYTAFMNRSKLLKMLMVFFQKCKETAVSLKNVNKQRHVFLRYVPIQSA